MTIRSATRSAQDRPYKPAIPTTRALDILGDEVKRGQIDPELFRLFVEAKVWE
jgi:HD-GYP domain-containing protein (c-di-GMP phosphodiesterase class II)